MNFLQLLLIDAHLTVHYLMDYISDLGKVDLVQLLSVVVLCETSSIVLQLIALVHLDERHFHELLNARSPLRVNLEATHDEVFHMLVILRPDWLTEVIKTAHKTANRRCLLYIGIKLLLLLNTACNHEI